MTRRWSFGSRLTSSISRVRCSTSMRRGSQGSDSSSGRSSRGGWGGVGGAAQQRGGEGTPPPLEVRQVLERAVERLRRHVFGRGAIPGAGDGERVHAVKVALVELTETVAGSLRGLCQAAFRR